MKSKKSRGIVSLAVALLLLIYVGYQVYIINDEGIATETASYAELTDTLQARGFVVRNEKVIKKDNDGVLSFSIPDGHKLPKGGIIADLYQSSEDVLTQNEVVLLNEEIATLSTLSQPGEYYITDPNLINKQIRNSVSLLMNNIRKGHLTDLANNRSEFQIALNKKRVITGKESSDDYLARITQLETEKNELIKKMGKKVGTITAPSAGYFIAAVDGLESTVNPSTVEELSVKKIKEMLELDYNIPDSSTVVGKIASDFNWFLCTVLKTDDIVKLENRDLVYIEIPYATTEKIPARIIAKNRNEETGEVAVIFECSNMDADIANIRNEMVQINIETYTGVTINERSIFFEEVESVTLDEKGNKKTEKVENVKGVYVKNGGRLEFVQVFSDKTINGYAICRTNLTDADSEALVTDKTIKLYDEVAVGGSGLYDGKLIN